jgi:aspartate aminotransferase-like enzyme
VPGLKKYLFTPGPVAVPPEVLLEMARPIIHHRTPEFSAVLDRARTLMQPLFGTRQQVILLTASGTGAMEAAVTNLLAPGDHALFVNGGKFACALRPGQRDLYLRDSSDRRNRRADQRTRRFVGR